MPEPNKFNILIIDDNPGFIQSFIKLIDDVAGDSINQVSWAANVYDGITKAKNTCFRFIFMNVKMEDIEDIHIARSVNTCQCTQSQIIAMSFYSQNIFKEQVLKEGANYFIEKDNIDHQALTTIFQFTINPL